MHGLRYVGCWQGSLARYADALQGTLESPEWRKGPSGPKTLCNACGLRWAKKEKKKSSGNVNNMMNLGVGMMDNNG